jgi:hypothetical protein
VVPRRQFNGAKRSTEAVEFLRKEGLVGERRVMGEAAAQARRGRYASENAGMSSERRVRNPSAESPRFPGER